MFSLKDKALEKDIVNSLKRMELDLKFMHVCGTHQDTLVKNGLDSLLKGCGIEIGQGPGCPVCVTTPLEIEEMLLLAKKGKIVTSFGDMINVPGEKNSLRSMIENGYDVRTVYGIEDAVLIAVGHSNGANRLNSRWLLRKVLREVVNTIDMRIIKGPIVSEAENNPGLEGYAAIDKSNITISTYTAIG